MTRHRVFDHLIGITRILLERLVFVIHRPSLGLSTVGEHLRVVLGIAAIGIGSHIHPSRDHLVLGNRLNVLHRAVGQHHLGELAPVVAGPAAGRRSRVIAILGFRQGEPLRLIIGARVANFSDGVLQAPDGLHHRHRRASSFQVAHVQRRAAEALVLHPLARRGILVVLSQVHLNARHRLLQRREINRIVLAIQSGAHVAQTVVVLIVPHDALDHRGIEGPEAGVHVALVMALGKVELQRLALRGNQRLAVEILGAVGRRTGQHDTAVHHRHGVCRRLHAIVAFNAVEHIERHRNSVDVVNATHAVNARLGISQTRVFRLNLSALEVHGAAATLGVGGQAVFGIYQQAGNRQAVGGLAVIVVIRLLVVHLNGVAVQVAVLGVVQVVGRRHRQIGKLVITVRIGRRRRVDGLVVHDAVWVCRALIGNIAHPFVGDIVPDPHLQVHLDA